MTTNMEGKRRDLIAAINQLTNLAEDDLANALGWGQSLSGVHKWAMLLEQVELTVRNLHAAQKQEKILDSAENALISILGWGHDYTKSDRVGVLIDKVKEIVDRDRARTAEPEPAVENVGRFESSRALDKSGRMSRLPGVNPTGGALCGVRFDRIELTCTAADLNDHRFMCWFQESLSGRVVNAREIDITIKVV